MLKSASNFTDKHVQDLSMSTYNSVPMLHVSHFIAEKYLLFLFNLLHLFCLFSSVLHNSHSLAKQSFICLIYSKPNLFHLHRNRLWLVESAQICYLK